VIEAVGIMRVCSMVTASVSMAWRSAVTTHASRRTCWLGGDARPALCWPAEWQSCIPIDSLEHCTCWQAHCSASLRTLHPAARRWERRRARRCSWLWTCLHLNLTHSYDLPRRAFPACQRSRTQRTVNTAMSCKRACTLRQFRYDTSVHPCPPRKP